MTVAVVVVEATGLTAEDGEGSSNPFVEVELCGKIQRTTTKFKDLSPTWNETFLFEVHNISQLPNLEINITVLHDQSAAADCPTNSSDSALRHRVIATAPKQKASFLGEVRIPGKIIDIDTDCFRKIVRRFILRKNELHSQECGSIAICAYFVDANDGITSSDSEDNKATDEMIEEYCLKETHPNIPAFHGHNRSRENRSRYDLVEQMEFLYVHIIEACGLPTRTHPYVMVTDSNYKRCTKYLEDNQQWNQVLAFPSKNLGSDVLKITVRNKVKDELVGCILLDLAKLKDKNDSDGSSWSENKEHMGTDDTEISHLNEINGFCLERQWYKLEDQHGEIMLSVWIGTQSDSAFQDVLHAYPDSITLSEQINSGSMVCYSPKLAYLRIHVIGAKDLVSKDITRLTYAFVRAQLGEQLEQTTPVMFQENNNLKWHEQLMFVISTSSTETIVLTVVDLVAPDREEEISRITIPISSIPRVPDIHENKLEPKWYDLSKCAGRAQSCGKVQLCLSVDLRYHVFDEPPEISSDFQPTSKEFARPCIGRVEVGIIKGCHLQATKLRNGQSTADVYCIAKYGQKWVCTRTILGSCNPEWNEQYAWEVFDPCTVITVAVFNNNTLEVENCNMEDSPIGKVQIRLSTLESGRTYSHAYPLIKLLPSGVEKMGELHLVVRFTCTAWANMITLYGKPLLPDVHYIQPIPDKQLDKLRHSAKNIIIRQMSNSQSALPKEVVDYMVDPEVWSSIWSLRNSKARFFRIMAALSGFFAFYRGVKDSRNWKNPKVTILVDALFVFLICYPWLVLPGIFFCLSTVGVWNYRFRPRHPPLKDMRFSHLHRVHPDELDEELNGHPSDPSILLARYDRLRTVAARVQVLAGDIANQGERLSALLTWRDPRVTVICIVLSFIMAIILYITPFRVVVMILGLYWLNYPDRSIVPPIYETFFWRVPPKRDMLLY